MDLSTLAEAVGATGPVAAAGHGTRGGARPEVRIVSAPAGIDWFQADEMTVSCGAGTPVDELAAVLAEHGQYASLGTGGTVGGALSHGRSDVYRLGHGPIRDALLQTRYVSETGEVVTAGGPTVKNVTGFDVCRVLVGAHGSLGILGDVILRTRPLPASSRWFGGPADPFAVLRRVYRPASILWDGATTWVCLEGHPSDVDEQATLVGLPEVAGPPALPVGGRRSMPPSALRTLDLAADGPFVAEVGIGVVHTERPIAVTPVVDPVLAALHQRIKQAFDPDDRFGPLPGPWSG